MKKGKRENRDVDQYVENNHEKKKQENGDSQIERCDLCTGKSKICSLM